MGPRARMTHVQVRVTLPTSSQSTAFHLFCNSDAAFAARAREKAGGRELDGAASPGEAFCPVGHGHAFFIWRCRSLSPQSCSPQHACAVCIYILVKNGGASVHLIGCTAAPGQVGGLEHMHRAGIPSQILEDVGNVGGRGGGRSSRPSRPAHP